MRYRRIAPALAMATALLTAAAYGDTTASLALLQKQNDGPDVDQAVVELVDVLRRGGKPAETMAATLDALPEKPPPAKLGVKLTGLTRVMTARQYFAERDQPAAETKPHPWAATFPGAVPAEAQRITRTVQASATQPGWQGTGLYAGPGDVITVRIPDEAAGKGWSVRVGCHTDHLWKDATWRRFPEIVRTWPLKTPETKVANPFGGLVYVTGPANAAGTLAVTLEGAVATPRYVAGSTDAPTWKAERANPGPWAEIEARKVVLTVPSKEIRKLDDPAPLTAFWDQVLDADAKLAGRPPERNRPERYAADIQISAGYMHSGYPIMTHLDAAPRMVDVANLKARGEWGLFHEMGHNHQNGDWTFAGTGEVTCNLFTLYVLENVCDNPPRRKGLSPAENLAKMKAHAAAGADFAAWQKDPFLALSMYVQLRDAFGWEVFEKVLAEYRTLPAKDHPKSDDAKRDQWMVRMAQATGKNLGPFFDAWGVPVSKEAKGQVKDLPAWMPEGWAPATQATTGPGKPE